MGSKPTARILDLDGSVTSQSRLVSRLSGSLEVVHLRELGPAVRYLPTDKSARELDETVTALEPRWLAFLGSGDFHHAAAAVLKGIEEPFSLVVIDQHSDWMKNSPCPCGAWLREALKLPNLERVVSLGVGDRSIAGWLISHAPFREILSGRVELYPLECKLSKHLGRHGASETPATEGMSRGLRCAKLRKGLFATTIYWRTIQDEGWEAIVREAVDGLPGDRVYLSIDKDCLAADYAFTNWGNGGITLDQLLFAVGLIRERKELIGVDISGEWSQIEVANSLLQKMAVKTHPISPAPTPEELARNEDTNLALLDALGIQ